MMESTAGQLVLGLLLLAVAALAFIAGLFLLVWLPLVVPQPHRRTPRRGRARIRATARTARDTIATRLRRWPVTATLTQVVGHPARMVVLGFGAAVLLGSVLLALPFATGSGQAAPVMTAVFTATSAVCVTGLVVVDTGTYWSTFGELVILLLIQIGGFGIMTLASLLGLLVARRLRMRLQLGTQAETKALGVGEVRRVILNVLRITVVVEVLIAAVLTWRFADGYGHGWGRATYLGVFHSVSAFNNAGFGLYPDSLMRFVGDPLICLPIVTAIIIGGLGFPVLFELRREWRTPQRWSLHTKITMGMTGILLAGGWLAIGLAEWTNPKTLGPLGVADRLLAGLVTAVMPRTAGFNSLDIAGMHDFTLLMHDVLMFIGGGSASTAGGIKVTTFAVLGFVILAEIRGEPSVHALGRKLPAGVQRQALTIALLGVAAIAASTLALLVLTPFALDVVLFETVSAFATVGLSTGITAQVGTAGHVILSLLMFIGRLGPITAVTALALRERTRRYERPEERPVVG
ncbi:TrkH family potassium uptake protein [Paractinoplanes brasiliensis]|uniref:Potassium uptake TrkH family protein n=1 Tax=Paractinoplanes brasiliensis TaxID=52695 RepID=A0A4R6JY46_9ACTN|nr:potassium transporter TrkG [Actinoplanes brasiliensis]TDO39665.1 potassium uptake TrkH family protein [Actinoplanes brasiliensis]GID28997.1 potassium transporter Trk [Actinoplanes brasiliensis]